VEKKNEFGNKKGKVRPYIIDLESANGTKINGDLVPAKRYLELRDGDILSFGESTREYVVQLPPPDG
jgi:smad nuclear-interacting protein 1